MDSALVRRLAVGLILMLLSAAHALAQGGSHRPGVAGRVVVSPSCPGPQKIDQPPCSSPLAGARLILQSREGQPVRTVDADAEGRFVFDVPPGHYRIHVQIDGVYPRCPDVAVSVPKAGRGKPVDIVCDSGMR